MIKRLTVMLSITLLFGATACDDDGDDNKPVDGSTSETGTSTDTGHGDTVTDAGATETGLGAGTLGMSTGPFVAFDNPFGDGRPNPVALIKGSAKADSVSGGKMTLLLEVSGVPGNMTFGSHLHKLACTNNKAGGHYQHMPAPDQDAGADANGPSDPAYGNPTNEAWLDFTTDNNGKGLGMTTVDWVPAMAADAQSIIVHAMKTGDGGIAGAKLACLPFAFKK
jgi:hypothetical protein